MSFDIPSTLITTDIRAPLCFLGQTTLTSLLICTTPKRSLLRPAILPVLTILAYCSYYTSAKFTGQAVLFSWFIVGPYANIYHCWNVLCLHPLDNNDILREMARWKRASTPAALYGRIFFTTATLLSFRGIGSSWQIPGIPPVRPRSTNSRAQFIGRQASITIIQYLIMDFFVSMEPSPEMAVTWAEGKEWLWIPSLNPHPVTTDDLVSRAVGATLGWFVVGRIMNDVGYRIISIIAVGIGLSAPEQWPPVFGSYSDCYTLRGYFGKFWHQLLRWPIQDVSVWITQDVLHIPRRSVLNRYAKISLFFFISGTLHLLLDTAWGIPWQKSGSLQCFMILAMGIVVEDGVRAVWRRLMKRNTAAPPTMFERAVGYLWVWTSLVIVSPIFSFPMQRLEGNPTYMMPFSVVKAVKGW
ncbi:hypothetical protein Q7P37_010902 [Cladosporium fusiforme]